MTGCATAPLLRRQCGEPLARISEADARERGIVDHDRIRVFDDSGEFILRAAGSPAVQPGVVICYHAWEGFQFPGGAVQNNVAACPMKPTSMVGDYGQFSYPMDNRNHFTRASTVDAEQVEVPERGRIAAAGWSD